MNHMENICLGKTNIDEQVRRMKFEEAAKMIQINLKGFSIGSAIRSMDDGRKGEACYLYIKGGFYDIDNRIGFLPSPPVAGRREI